MEQLNQRINLLRLPNNIMRRAIGCVSLVAFSLIGSDASGMDPVVLRSSVKNDVNISQELEVMTWNIHGGLTVNGDANQSQVMMTVAKVNADITCLQEVPEAYIDDLQQVQSGLSVIFVPTYQNPWNGEKKGNAMLTKGTIKSVTSQLMYFTVYRPARAVSYASVMIGDKHMGVINIHTESHVASLRAQQGRVLVESIEAEKPDIICGDFNEPSYGLTRQNIQKAGYNSPTCSNNNPASIDAVYLTLGLEARSTCLNDIATKNTSDHTPVIVSTKLNTN